MFSWHLLSLVLYPLSGCLPAEYPYNCVRYLERVSAIFTESLFPAMTLAGQKGISLDLEDDLPQLTIA